jgi:four helix bundle protein
MAKGEDIAERLINFAALCIDIAQSLPKDFAGNYFSGQLVRSGSSPALHYGEVQAAESRGDFVHKMKVCRKNCGKLIIVFD